MDTRELEAEPILHARDLPLTKARIEPDSCATEQSHSLSYHIRHDHSLTELPGLDVLMTSCRRSITAQGRTLGRRSQSCRDEAAGQNRSDQQLRWWHLPATMSPPDG